MAQSVGRLKVVMPIVALPRGVSAGTRLPPGGLDDGVLGVGRDVEPVPAAVAEGVERELEDQLGGLGGDAGGVDAVRGAAGIGLVDDHGARAGDGQVYFVLVLFLPTLMYLRRFSLSAFFIAFFVI